MRILLVFIGACLSQQALACSCLKSSLSGHYAMANQVFIGVAVQSKEKNQLSKITDFEVKKVYKGDIGERVKIHTGAESAACGIPFETGGTYLVFSDKKNRTGICSGTRSYPGTAWGESQEEVDAFLESVEKNLPSR